MNVVWLVVLAASAAAGEQDAPDLPEIYAEEEEEEAGVEEAARVEDLEARVRELEAQLRAEEALVFEPSLQIAGYADFGFFKPFGTGVGAVRDTTGMVPGLSDRFGWVFLGDLLSTEVNSRGEAASLGDLPGVARFDSVDSQGAAGFLLNEVNLSPSIAASRNLHFRASINFVPRTGDEFSIGDFIEVDLAHIEWTVSDEVPVTLFAGKIAPVVGIEYPRRKARDRAGITPSLIARYTMGSQLGVQARARLFSERLLLAASVTNGSSVMEEFHFAREVDSNDGKTVSGRAAVRLPIAEVFGGGAGTLELGASGEIGAQDRALDSDGVFWLGGVDLRYEVADLVVRAELLRGGSPGRATDGAYALDLRTSGYVEVEYLVLPQLGLLARGELRDALVTFGSERAYLTKGWRVTGGARVIVSNHLVLKAEYLHNGEYGDVPSFDNDVLTTSLVLAF